MIHHFCSFHPERSCTFNLFSNLTCRQSINIVLFSYWESRECSYFSSTVDCGQHVKHVTVFCGYLNHGHDGHHTVVIVGTLIFVGTVNIVCPHGHYKEGRS